MNYKKIYDNLIHYCKNTPVIDRLKNRNTNDPRLMLSEDEIYVETHHIKPSHDLGDDSPDNLVTLLPEEHYLAHFIRYKALNQPGDYLAVRIIINGLSSKKYRKIKDQYASFSMNKRIALFRQYIQSFRKEHGWQTSDGRERISKARKGTFPCVDAVTGEAVGSHNKNHPKILSGEWVHHSKGKVSVTNIETGERLYVKVSEIEAQRDLYKTNHAPNKGSLNANYKEMTDEHRKRILILVGLSIEDNIHFNVSKFERLLKIEFKDDFKKISTVWIINNFGSFDILLSEYNKINGTDYKRIPYYRSTNQRKAISDSNIGKPKNVKNRKRR